MGNLVNVGDTPVEMHSLPIALPSQSVFYATLPISTVLGMCRICHLLKRDMEMTERHCGWATSGIQYAVVNIAPVT